ncbi:M48 family metallopeptidase [Sulfurimonas gotlandica]|uniref:M48 family metallopeptidase n=1 Tax=Sulfurimonas gotlandica TaxID=1176482 RepID=UPI0021CF9D49|nr:SprT family zinc-dependent metalloprotease [Sulfurimonas gotlandica]
MIQLTTSEISFKDLNIIHICKPSLKNSYISIREDLKVVLKTSKVSRSYIEKLLIEKEGWIRKQLFKREQNPPIQINLEDEVLLFGEVYSVDADESTELRNLLHRLRKPNQKNILRCYDDFYKIFGKSHLGSRLEYYSQIMDLNYKEMKLKKMRSRWGSCSSDRVITFNTQLIKLEKEQIDYVVVHELAHLVHMNHSKDFHNLVKNYFPDAMRVRKEIRSRQNFTF